MCSSASPARIQEQLPAGASLRHPRDALEKLEFVPARVEVCDFVAGRFQLSFHIAPF